MMKKQMNKLIKVPMVMNYSHNSINVLKRTIDIEHIIKWLDQFQSHTLKFSSG
jgi:hypothetical protein